MKNTKTSSPALSVERSEAERSEDERSAAAGDQGIADRPNPEVVASAKRRSFTAGYKQRILAEADKAKEESGGIGALLRRDSTGSAAPSPSAVPSAMRTRSCVARTSTSVKNLRVPICKSGLSCRQTGSFNSG
jgi:hypothetical protein